MVKVSDPATAMIIRISGVRERHRHTINSVMAPAIRVMPSAPPKFVNAGPKVVGERRTPGDDLVEGGLVEAGDSVFFSDRVVDPGAGCGEAQDDQAADTRGDGKECVRREVALERSQRSKAGLVRVDVTFGPTPVRIGAHRGGNRSRAAW